MMICISILATTNENALAQMEKSALLADILELRIDHVRDVDLRQLMREKRTKILVTNRRRDEGGAFPGTERARVELLKEAVVLGADYVDIEAGTEKKLLNELVAQIEKYHARTKWIISSHNFNGTPPEKALLKKFDRFSRTGADIVKIVTLAQTIEDNLKALRLIPYARIKGCAIIAFCMGEKGRISRVIAPLLGSCWSYAALEKGRESAPGQLTIDEMKQIQKILGLSGAEEP